MSKKGEEALPGQGQGDKTFNTDNYVNNVYKTLYYPSCFGKYYRWTICARCDVVNQCRRVV